MYPEVTIKEEPRPEEQPQRDPPLLINTRPLGPPPLVRTNAAPRPGNGLPRLIQTRIVPHCPRQNLAPVAPVVVSAPATPASESKAPAPPAPTTATCCIGKVYRVPCHRQYLGASHGFRTWGSLDPSLQSTIQSKIQHQVKPEATDLICLHHLQELSYKYEPNSADSGRGPCSGYGIVHKVPATALTTRLGVLTYYNGIAGKNRDVLPGKFVCSTCVNILRGNLKAFLPADACGAPAPSIPAQKTSSQPTLAQKISRVHPYRRKVYSNKRCQARRDFPAETIDTDDGEQEVEFRLQPSMITITEFKDQDPLNLSTTELGEGTHPRFQKLNRILATAGVAPFLVQNSGTSFGIGTDKFRALHKITQVVRNCVNLFQEDGVDIDVQSVYNSIM